MKAAPSDSGPIGRVTTRDAGGETVYTLLGPDRWRVTVAGAESPEMAESLRRRFKGSYWSPEQGFYGQLILRTLAEDVGGTLEMIEPFDDDPAAIY